MYSDDLVKPALCFGNASKSPRNELTAANVAMAATPIATIPTAIFRLRISFPERGEYAKAIPNSSPAKIGPMRCIEMALIKTRSTIGNAPINVMQRFRAVYAPAKALAGNTR